MSASGDKQTFCDAIDMSALGQKQTCAVQTGMSALPSKATSNATYGTSATEADIVRCDKKKDRLAGGLSEIRPGVLNQAASRPSSAMHPFMPTGSTPAVRSPSALVVERVVPTTWCPASSSRGTRRFPTAPPAAAKKLFMTYPSLQRL